MYAVFACFLHYDYVCSRFDSGIHITVERPRTCVAAYNSSCETSLNVFVQLSKMKRSKFNTDYIQTKEIKPNTSDEYRNNSENDNDEVEVLYNYKTYFKYKTKNNDKVGVFIVSKKK